MNRIQIEDEINQIVHEIPDSLITEIYNLLVDYSSSKNQSIKLSDSLDKILSEDSNLLKRLAK